MGQQDTWEIFYYIRLKRIFELLEALKNELSILALLFEEDSRQNEERTTLPIC